MTYVYSRTTFRTGNNLYYNLGTVEANRYLLYVPVTLRISKLDNRFADIFAAVQVTANLHWKDIEHIILNEVFWNSGFNRQNEGFEA